MRNGPLWTVPRPLFEKKGLILVYEFMCSAFSKKYRNHAFSIRNLEAPINNIPIIPNTVSEPTNSFVSTITKSKADVIAMHSPFINMILFTFTFLGYLRIERLLPGAHQMPWRPERLAR